MPKLLMDLSPPAVKPATEALSLRDLPNRRLKQLRDELEFSQVELAKLMRNAGFSGWTRNTVAAIELGQRRFHEDEQLALATFLMIPMVWFVLPQEGERIRFPGKELAWHEATELILGDGGSAGRMGPPSPAAARALGIRENEAPEAAERFLRRQRDAAYRAQLAWIYHHLPEGELDPDDLEAHEAEAQLIPISPGPPAGTLMIVRRSDGARYAYLGIEEGVARYTTEDGAGRLTTFRNGEVVDEPRNVAPPAGLAELN